MFGGENSDGEPVLQMSVSDYMYDGAVMFNFIWIIATVVIGVVYLVFLIINLCLLKKRKGDTAAKFAALGQGGMILSVLTVEVYFLILPFTAGTTVVTCCIVIACIFTMAAAAVLLMKNVLTVKAMKHSAKVRHIITVLACVLTTVFLMYFELFAFWI